jgi:hypothetical protein
MAVWQFPLTVIPKKGLIEKMGYIPEKLPIDYEERKRYEKDKQEKEDINELDYKDALTKDWWASTNILPIEIIHQMDKIVNRANWGNSDIWTNWKTYSNEKGKEVDNDAHLTINAQSGKIEYLGFRADLRESSWLFLTKMIELGQLYDWVFMDRLKGTIAQADKTDMKRLVYDSNPFRFLKDPEAFLNDLDINRIQPK